MARKFINTMWKHKEMRIETQWICKVNCFKARDLTSSKPWRLSQTLVPLISDTCRSEVSPPKITKTFCLDVPLWIAPICFDGCSFLDKAVQALLHGTREGNREQACWTTVRRIREWENPTWKVLFLVLKLVTKLSITSTRVFAWYLLYVTAW